MPDAELDHVWDHRIHEEVPAEPAAGEKDANPGHTRSLARPLHDVQIHT